MFIIKTGLISLLSAYVPVAFYVWELNPGEWPQSARGVYVLLYGWVAVSLIVRRLE